MKKSTYKRLFSTDIILKAIKKNRVEFYNYLKHINFSTESNTLSNIYIDIYKRLFKEFRYEYVFKNEFFCMFLNQILSGNYKLLYEVEIYHNNTLTNMLDLLLITPTYALAIEIKGDFDSSYRLENQLTIYSKLFKFVSIFVSDYKVSMYEEFMNDLHFDNVGIISLTEDSINTIKQPVANNTDILALKENIIYRQPGFMPEKDTNIYEYWIKLISSFTNVDISFINAMPRPLKFYAYSHGFLKPLKRSRIKNAFIKR